MIEDRRNMINQQIAGRIERWLGQFVAFPMTEKPRLRRLNRCLIAPGMTMGQLWICDDHKYSEKSRKEKYD